MKTNTYQNAFYAALRNRFKTLFNQYLKRVVLGGGAIDSDSVTKGYMKMCQDKRMDKSIKFAWLGDAGSTIVDGRVSKIFSLENTNDATQPTEANRPYISGNIAPNEHLGLCNPNGGNCYMTHPEISFASGDSWSVTTVLNWNGSETLYSEPWSDGTDNNKLEFSEDLRFKNSTNILTLTSTGFLKIHIGKTIYLNICATNNQILVYINGTLVNTVGGNTATIISTLLRAGIPIRTHTGKLFAHIIRSQALTQSQITAEYNYLSSIYPEIPSVVIGGQTFGTSNVDVVSTCRGNLIANVTDDGNVEKIDDITLDDSSKWTILNSTVIGDGIATVNSSITEQVFVNRKIVTSGKWYKCIIEIKSSSSGSFGVSLGGSGFAIVQSTTGVYTAYYKCDSTEFVSFYSINGFVGSVDNISIQEIGFSGSGELYDGIYAQTVGTDAEKQYAACKAAAMWSYYNNNPAIGAVYGKLYNWFAIKLLQMDIDYYNAENPSNHWGWHVPSQAEWDTLITTLGGASVAGGKIKALFGGFNNEFSSNESGFSLIAGGLRNTIGEFSGINESSDNVSIESIFYEAANVTRTYVSGSISKIFGLSLHWIKD